MCSTCTYYEQIEATHLQLDLQQNTMDWYQAVPIGTYRIKYPPVYSRQDGYGYHLCRLKLLTYSWTPCCSSSLRHDPQQPSLSVWPILFTFYSISLCQISKTFKVGDILGNFSTLRIEMCWGKKSYSHFTQSIFAKYIKKRLEIGEILGN